MKINFFLLWAACPTEFILFISLVVVSRKFRLKTPFNLFHFITPKFAFIFVINGKVKLREYDAIDFDGKYCC